MAVCVVGLPTCHGNKHRQNNQNFTKTSDKIETYFINTGGTSRRFKKYVGTSRAPRGHLEGTSEYPVNLTQT